MRWDRRGRQRQECRAWGCPCYKGERDLWSGRGDVGDKNAGHGDALATRERGTYGAGAGMSVIRMPGMGMPLLQGREGPMERA
jgi:hypothetical protein